MINSDRHVNNSRTLKALATLAFLSCTAMSPAQCLRYSVDVIQPPQPCFPGLWPGIAATGLSDVGEICGGGGTCGKTESAHFVWYGSPPVIYLSMPPAYPGGQPTDINSVRQVVGYMSDLNAGAPRAYMHHNGTTLNLGTLPGHTHSVAHAISESGLVCGLSMISATGPLNAFLWADGVMTGLGLPVGRNAEALDISDLAGICGWMGPGNPVVDSHAFIYQPNGIVVDLGTVFDGAIGAIARSINNLGNACGTSHFEDSQHVYIRRGFYWHDGVAQDLGMFPGFVDCLPAALNDDNIIVGNSTGGPDGAKGFVWTSGVMQKLEDLVITDLDLSITAGAAINNAGQIAAYGHYPDPNGSGIIYVAMRLNPIPPLAGDLNCDWQVNVPDLLAVISAWGPCPPPPPGEPFTKNCHADFNNDGVVNHHDILAVVLNWTS